MLTTPLLVGLDGEQKMSKSLGNYVGVNEPPGEQFGKIMSIPDPLLPMYFAHATAWPPEKIDEVTERSRERRAAPERGQTARRPHRRRPLPRGRRGRRGRGRIRPRPQGPRRARPTCPSTRCRAGTRGQTPWSRPVWPTRSATARRSIDARRGQVRRRGRRAPTEPVPDGTHVVQNGKRKWARITVGVIRVRVGCPGAPRATAGACNGCCACLTCATPTCSLVSRPACRFATRTWPGTVEPG